MERRWNDTDRGKVGMEQWWNDTDRGNPAILIFKSLPLPLFSTTNHIYTGLESNPHSAVRRQQLIALATRPTGRESLITLLLASPKLSVR